MHRNLRYSATRIFIKKNPYSSGLGQKKSPQIRSLVILSATSSSSPHRRREEEDVPLSDRQQKKKTYLWWFSPASSLSSGSLSPSTSKRSFFLQSPYLFPPNLSLLSPPITSLSALSAFSPNLSSLRERSGETAERDREGERAKREIGWREHREWWGRAERDRE